MRTIFLAPLFLLACSGEPPRATMRGLTSSVDGHAIQIAHAWADYGTRHIVVNFLGSWKNKTIHEQFYLDDVQVAAGKSYRAETTEHMGLYFCGDTTGQNGASGIPECSIDAAMGQKLEVAFAAAEDPTYLRGTLQAVLPDGSATSASFLMPVLDASASAAGYHDDDVQH